MLLEQKLSLKDKMATSKNESFVMLFLTSTIHVKEKH
tara:strand:- start:783 stop:893 length:111 start_codon:yes stop_codon:yes gene_type:complete